MYVNVFHRGSFWVPAYTLQGFAFLDSHYQNPISIYRCLGAPWVRTTHLPSVCLFSSLEPSISRVVALAIGRQHMDVGGRMVGGRIIS